MKRSSEKSKIRLFNDIGSDDSVGDNDEAVATGIVESHADSGVVLTQEEERLFTRMDRLSGKDGGSNKRARTGKAPKKKTALEREPRANLPFDKSRTNEDEKLKDYLNFVLPKRREARVFAGNDNVVKKHLYGETDDNILHPFIDIIEDPIAPGAPLQYLSVPMRKKIASMQCFEQAEIKLRPVDLAWKAKRYDNVKFPAGLGINITNVASFMESNSTLDVFALEVTVPNGTEQVPAWVLKHLQGHFEDKVINIASAGIIVLSLILDAASLFQLRVVYIYGVLSDESIESPATLIRQSDFDSILAKTKIGQGESRYRLERFDIINAEDKDPILSLPAIYVGRYYISPAPLEKIEANTLSRRLTDGGLLWDLQPVFEAYDKEEEEGKEKLLLIIEEGAKEKEEKPITPVDDMDQGIV